MRLSRRERHDWRIFIALSVMSAAVSAYFGYVVAPPDTPMPRALFAGVVNSLLIATPIFLFEIKSRRPGPLRRLRRLPLLVYFGLKVLFYIAVIVGGLTLARATVSPRDFIFDEVFRDSIVFAVAMAVFGNLVFEMGGLLGYGTLKNLLTGRYVQPKREQRVFLLIDMKDSTGLAERLGPVRFHELLNEFFRDVADAALECEAEIHKYVGDEVILTWPADRALRDGYCLACPFIARDRIAANGALYREKFGAVPEFRAALHCGEIVAGEIGDVRREIAYVGDTLNVAARLLEAAKTTGRDVLASADLLNAVALPLELRAEPLPTLSLRGRTQPLEISALSRVGQD
ncbi:MAG: adenylate/guanylate cyclase domain-containing protein [Reyranella sp.]|nr:adenylate/guanylate cyclase domain-containing protein [Reyranella sp.]